MPGAVADFAGEVLCGAGFGAGWSCAGFLAVGAACFSDVSAAEVEACWPIGDAAERVPLRSPHKTASASTPDHLRPNGTTLVFLRAETRQANC